MSDHLDGEGDKAFEWLQSAYELDTALLAFGKNLARLGFPNDLKSTGGNGLYYCFAN